MYGVFDSEVVWGTKARGVARQWSLLIKALFATAVEIGLSHKDPRDINCTASSAGRGDTKHATSIC